MLVARAPATSANLGPGFDCLALALDLWNEFELAPIEDGVTTISVDGEGADALESPSSNLAYRTLERLAELAGSPLPSVALRCVSRIPLERGLGSSATAVAAGVLLGERLLG